jgi:hypothetical protein
LITFAFLILLVSFRLVFRRLVTNATGSHLTSETTKQPNVGIDFLIPPLNPRSNVSTGRRYSTAVVNYGSNSITNQAPNLLNTNPNSAPSYTFLQTLGNGMVNTFHAPYSRRN